MTGELLQSDIDLAKRMIQARNPDLEIITALSRRGLAPAKAEQLVHALRSGSPVQLHARIEGFPGGVPTSTSAGAGAGKSASAAIERKPSRRASSAEGPKSSSVSWFSAALLVGLGAAAGIAIATYLHHPKSESLPAALGVAATPDKSRPKTPPPSLALSIQQEGLRIGGVLVTHENALQTIASLIGAPNRTNQLEEPGKVLYAYDAYGLVIYSQEGVRDEHIVLHFEAIGGAKGTTTPFSGTLKIDDFTITADTDAQTLAAIKSLGLDPPREDKHVFGGQYNGLELYFTFFETTQHLSLIEVKLK